MEGITMTEVTRDIDYYIEHPDEFEALSDADRAGLLDGSAVEGENIDAPPAVDDQVTESASSDPEPEPVLLAKDGKHTIPFEELQTTREQVKALQQQVEDLRKQIPPAEEPPQPPSIDELEAQLEEAREQAFLGDEEARDRVKELRAQIRDEHSRLTNARIASALETQRVEYEQAATAAAVNTAVAAVVAKYPWLDHSGANADHDAIEKVRWLRDGYISKGMAPDKAIIAASEDMARFKTGPALEKPALHAKAKPPSSLSSIPSAGVVAADEVEAILQENRGHLLQDKFMRMTPDQREKVMSRLM